LGITLDSKKKDLLRDKIARVIRESILQGALKPGEQLVEAVLAKKMNVSRAPLREAFLFLEQENFVRVVPHEGTYVISLTPADISEIHLLRHVLEPLAAIDAARHLESVHKHELLSILSAMREAADRDNCRQFYQNDLRFHQRIWALAGNRRLEGILNSLCSPLFTFRIINSNPRRGWLAERVAAHEVILSALENGDEGRIRASLKFASGWNRTAERAEIKR
jgi:GntR family transcriptional regulator of gluconate operon